MEVTNISSAITSLAHVHVTKTKTKTSTGLLAHKLDIFY